MSPLSIAIAKGVTIAVIVFALVEIAVLIHQIRKD
jgi:hypothetical protein